MMRRNYQSLCELVTEARHLRDSHNRVHKMDSHYAALRGWKRLFEKGEIVMDWDEVDQLITDMRRAGAILKWPQHQLSST